jgi:hypothetical protein
MGVKFQQGVWSRPYLFPYSTDESTMRGAE